jgi:hypothetical protein
MPVQQMMPDMQQILGRPLYPGESKMMWDTFEERMNIESETKRLANEQAKLQIEFERSKNAAIAKAIDLLMPRWERGGEPGQGQKVDVGQFQGQDVAVGPGAPGQEITPASGARYQEPTTRNQAQARSLMAPFMKVPEDPEAKFMKQMELMAAKEDERRATETMKLESKEKLATAAEAGKESRAAMREKEKEDKIELKENLRLKREATMQLEREMGNEYKEYNKRKISIERDPMLRPEQRNAQLEMLQDLYEATIETVAKRAKRHGIDIDASEFKAARDPSILSQKHIEWYKNKKRSKAEKKAFDKAYQEKFGKPHGLEG